MDPSGSSYSQPATHQRVFVDAQGISRKISLQAVELEGRPKLIRTLRNAGALVMSNAKEANIILVDASTESGRRLIRMWGHDPSKVVLEYSWLQKCIEAGRPLLEEDAWGGTLAVDDGQPVKIDGVVIDEETEVETLVTKSPLPTPRVTPVDLASQRADTQSPENAIAPRGTERVPLQATPVDPPPSLEEMHCAPPQVQPRPNPPSSNQLFQQAQSTSFVQASQMPPQSTHNSFSYPSFPAQSTPHIPMPPSHSHAMTMGPQLPSYNLQSQNLMSAYATLLDVMRLSAEQPSWSSQNTSPTQTLLIPNQPTVLAQPSSNSSGQQTQPSVHHPVPLANAICDSSTSTRSIQSSSDYAGAGMSRPMFSPQNHRREDASTVKRHSGVEKLNNRPISVHERQRKHSSRSSSTEVLAPSISGKGLSAAKRAYRPKPSRKGKERAITPESSEELEQMTYFDAIGSLSPTPSSSPTPYSRPLNIIAHKNSGEVFLSDTRQPLRFFVQVDLHGRHNIVSNIKRNKGKIVNNIPDADYVILYSRSKTVYDGLLSEAAVVGKLPLQAAFITDCVEECALLDEGDYALDQGPKPSPQKRGRQSASSFVVETAQTIKRKAKTKPLDNRGKVTPSKRPVDKAEKTSLPLRTEPTPVRNMSPSPPPAEARRMMKSGRYYFTEGEDEYLLRYAKYQFKQDPSMSHTALVHKVHAKMPHHTVASWVAHIDQKLKNSLDDIRKRANIAKRIYSPDRKESIGATSSEAKPGPPKKQRLSPCITDKNVDRPWDQSSAELLEREDFEVITQFFARGGGDDHDDERVWQELEKHRPCRTANSWPEYYAAHEREVYTRIEELMVEYAQ